MHFPASDRVVDVDVVVAIVVAIVVALSFESVVEMGIVGENQRIGIVPENSIRDPP